MQNLSLNDIERISLCEVLDRVLNKGVVVVGEVTISVADVDLIYLGLRLVLTSIETAREDDLQGPIGSGLMSNGHGLNIADLVYSASGDFECVKLLPVKEKY